MKRKEVVTLNELVKSNSPFRWNIDIGGTSRGALREIKAVLRKYKALDIQEEYKIVGDPLTHYLSNETEEKT